MRMNLIICNILLILIGFCSCSNNSPSSKVEEIVLEQKYSIDNDGDIIENGFIGDVDNVREISGKDEGFSNSILLRNLLIISFLILFNSIITLVVYDDKSDNLINNTIIVSVILSSITGIIFVVFGCHIMACSILQGIEFILLMILLMISRSKKNNPGRYISEYSITCPNCGGSLYIRRKSIGSSHVNSVESINVVWCNKCGLGNKPYEDDSIMRFIQSKGNLRVKNPSNVSRFSLYREYRLPRKFRKTISKGVDISKNLYMLFNNHICKFRIDYNKDTITLLDITSDKEVYEYNLGIGKDLSNESNNFNLLESLKLNYCGIYCPKGDDKCRKDNYSSCLLAKMNKALIDYNSSRNTSLSSSEVINEKLNIIKKLLETELCNIKCPLQKGKSDVCNGGECVINKVLNGL